MATPVIAESRPVSLLAFLSAYLCFLSKEIYFLCAGKLKTNDRKAFFIARDIKYTDRKLLVVTGSRFELTGSSISLTGQKKEGERLNAFPLALKLNAI